MVRHVKSNIPVYLGLVILMLLFFITRLYRFGEVPAGFHIDEIGASYDAQCIAHYGVDRYRVRFPVYFQNFGAGQNALYTYLGALLFKFTAFSPKKFRFIAVLCGALAMLGTFIISRKAFEDPEHSLTAPFLWVVMPVILMSERWGLESYLFLSFTAMALCLITLASDTGLRLLWTAAGIFTGLCLYTYGVSYVVIPLFLIIIYAYLLWLGKVALKETLLFGIPFILLAVPLVIEQLVTAEILPEFSMGLTDFRRMQFSRAGEFGLKYFLKNLDDISVFFTNDFLPYNGSARFGTVLYISIPFIVLGMIVCLGKAVTSLKKRQFDFSVLLFAFFAVSFLGSMCMVQLNINRVNEVYFALVFLAAYGINFLWKRFRFTPWVLLILYLVFFIPFCRYYYGDEYNADIAADESGVLFYNTDLGVAVKTLSDFYGGEKMVNIISNDAEERHILIADYCGTSPYEFDGNYSTAGNYLIGLPEELDISGSTVYVIGKDLKHIADYLATVGFTVDGENYGDYFVVMPSF